MKKFFSLLICTLFLCYGCSDDDKGYKVYEVSVQLVYPEGSELSAIEGLAVQLTTGSTSYDAATNANGLAVFTVPAGVYEASAVDKRSSDGTAYFYNGVTSNIVVTDLWTGEVVELNFTESKAGQVLIKELYIGGCQKDGGSGAFQYDKYVILYNNSDLTAELENVCLGVTLPYIATTTNNDYTDGALFYEAEGWIPAGSGIWYFPNKLTIEPYREVVIAMNQAIDHTQTYSNSVNLANESYYCTYDRPDVLTHQTYTVPSELIPTSHYLAISFYGMGTAWILGNISPAFFIFKTEGVTPAQFATDPNNINYYNNSGTQVNLRRKVPVEWVLDGIEVFKNGDPNNQKRLTPAVDGGATDLVNNNGYTSYRNVDKEATEAIKENAGLLVYSYNKGTTYPDGTVSTDPSGIDAEASLKKGARIVYQDTNNSSKDFHQRSQASLRD